MARLTHQQFTEKSDLTEDTVDLPTLGGDVKIKSLSAWFSDEASSEAIEMTTDHRGQQKGSINTAKLNAIKVQRALLDPAMGSVKDAEKFLRNNGRAAQKLIEAINEISGIDEDTVKDTEARFPVVGGNEKDSPAS